MFIRSLYSLVILPTIIVLITLFTPSCGDMSQRVDVFLVNCTEDNLRIENLTTNLHLVKDCVEWTEAVGYNSQHGAYLTSLDANITTKTFTFTRSVWNYKHKLILTVNAEKLKSATEDLWEPGDIAPNVVITLHEETGPDFQPSFTFELNGWDNLVGFTAEIEHNYN